jgi:hypothetical protein
MRLWWWRGIRPANIPQADRDIFERFGEFVIGSVLAGGFAPSHDDLVPYQKRNTAQQNYARDWLTERSDSHEQREQRVETVDWFILGFVIVGVILDVVLVILDLVLVLHTH